MFVDFPERYPHLPGIAVIGYPGYLHLVSVGIVIMLILGFADIAYSVMDLTQPFRPEGIASLDLGIGKLELAVPGLVQVCLITMG